MTEKQFHEESRAEREARHQTEIKAASAPPPLTTEEKIQLEREHIAAQEWLLGEPRYEASAESAAKLGTAMKELKLPCTQEGLRQGFEYCLKIGLLQPKREAPADPNAPKSILAWAAEYGLTRKSIRNMTKENLREKYNDPTNDYFFRRMIISVLQEGK
jgi:hypothetical protein